MKIGILTLHSQINYGGVLQAYALQYYLRGLGLDVEVIDYWLTPDNSMLTGFFLNNNFSAFMRLIRLPLWEVRDGFVIRELVRRKRTIRFLQRDVRMSHNSYRTPRELEEIAGYDTIVVGSDQVWNCRRSLGVPNPFLLGRVDTRIKRVAYAASFGLTELPSDRVPEYQEALRKFSEISVREASGQRLVEQLTERSATWVLDPTLLLSREEWLKVSGASDEGADSGLVCYWLGDLGLLLPLLQDCIKKGQRISLLCDWRQQRSRSQAQVAKLRLLIGLHPRIRCCFSAGPIEFVRELSNATSILSDSFHALMFATIFGKPVKIIHKSSINRIAMGGRITEFCERYRLGGVVSENIPDQYVDIPMPDYNQIRKDLAADRQRSMKYLGEALA